MAGPLRSRPIAISACGARRWARRLADPSAFAVNGVDDAVIVGTGRELGPRAILSFTVSDPTEHQLATVASAGDVVGTLTWTRDGRWLIAKVVRSS